MKNNSDLVNTLLISDGAHFHGSGYLNNHNCPYWVPNNTPELLRPLHSVKVTVWCAVYSQGIIGPYFFGNKEGCTETVHAERHKVMPEIFLRSELRPRQKHFLWFQQDGAPAHTTEISMQVLKTMFPGILVTSFGDITWPAHSYDLVVLDYFLWGLR